MFLELSEVFVCPRCRPAQGLVVLVDDIRDRRVRTGHLGCPECGVKVPVRGGVVRFDRARTPGGVDGASSAAVGGGSPPGGGSPATVSGGDAASRASREEAALFGGVDPSEAATRLAALLGTREGEGYLLLGEELAPLAAGVAGLAGGREVLALGPPADAEPGAEGEVEAEEAVSGEGPSVTHVVGVSPLALPLVSGRLGGAAVMGGRTGEVQEAARVLRPGARLVVVEPGPGVREALEGLPLEVAAAADEALVAVRPA